MPTCHLRPLPSRLLGLLFILLPATAWCQESTSDRDERAPVLLRVLCKVPVPGADDLAMVQAGEILHDLKVTPSLMTDPLGVGRGKLLLARETSGEDKAAFDPVVTVTIPAAGKRFVLALFPAPKPTAARPYQHRLIRIDNLRFGVSDLYLFNLTAVPIAGVLGKKNFTLAPGKSEVATPDPDKAGGRMYQSRFYYQRDGEARIFNDTRWPLAKSARVYLFFIPDPQRRSIGYHSFREYVPFP